LQPPDQGRQQTQGKNAKGVLQTAPQQHKATCGSTQPIKQRQCRTSSHYQSGLHATAHDELS